MFESSSLCQALSACAQLTTQQSNELLTQEWNIYPQPFFKTKMVNITKDKVRLFQQGRSTVDAELPTLLQRSAQIACDLAVKWRKEAEAGTANVIFGRLCGIVFGLGNIEANAWIFRHSHDLGFLIIPILVIVQPTMVMVDLVVPIGETLTECRGHPLELHFFPKVIVHNVLQQLLNVQPVFLPEIIGMEKKVSHNSLVHQLLHRPTWENIVRIAVVAVQQLVDPRMSYSQMCPDSPPAEPVNVIDLVEAVHLDIQGDTHPELFNVIKYGQLPAFQQCKTETSFTPEDIFDCVQEVVQPLVNSSLHAQLDLNVPEIPMSEVANAAMNDFFSTLPSPPPQHQQTAAAAADSSTLPKIDFPSPSAQDLFAMLEEW